MPFCRSCSGVDAANDQTVTSDGGAKPDDLPGGAALQNALGALGAFSALPEGAAFSVFPGCAGFCTALSFLPGASFCAEATALSLSALGGRPRRFGACSCSLGFSCFGPSSLVGVGEVPLSGAFASCLAAAFSAAFFSAMISEKLKTDTLAAFCSLGASAPFSGWVGVTCSGAVALSGETASGAVCSCLGAGVPPPASGCTGAGPASGPVASVTIFDFS